MTDLEHPDALVIDSDAPEAEEPARLVPLAALQREASEVNELNGVVAFCVGVLAEIQRCSSLADAKTIAEMGAQALEERRLGLWKPGPHDDPADWRRR